MPKLLAFVRYLVLVAVVIFFLFELLLRIATPFVSDSLQVLLREDARFDSNSALRVARGTKIILDSSDFEQQQDLVLIGDSMIFGLMLSEDQVVDSLLERQRNLKVLNLATSSAAACDYNQMLDLALESKNLPKAIVYSIFVNDFIVDHCDANKKFFIWRKDYQKDWRLQLRYYREYLFQSSLSYSLLKRFASSKPLHVSKTYTPVHYKGRDYEFMFATPEISLPITNLKDPQRLLAIDDLVSKVAHAASVATSNSISFYVLLMPFKEQVYLPSIIQSGELSKDLYDESYDESYDYIAQSLGSQDIKLIDLRDQFRDYASTGEKLYWTLDGHLNPQGHQRLADILGASIS